MHQWITKNMKNNSPFLFIQCQKYFMRLIFVMLHHKWTAFNNVIFSQSTVELQPYKKKAWTCKHGIMYIGNHPLKTFTNHLHWHNSQEKICRFTSQPIHNNICNLVVANIYGYCCLKMEVVDSWSCVHDYFI